MMREFNGKILLRIPKHIHKKLAQEAFVSGRSINQLCTEAILTRGALKDYNPWKSIGQLQQQNKNADPDLLAREIRTAIKESRRGSKD